MRKLIVPIVVAILGIGAVAACRYPKTPEERVARLSGWLEDELELDAAQKAKLDQLTQEGLALAKDFKAERANDFDTLVQQLGGTLERDTLLGFYGKRKALVENRAPALVDKLVAFHASLNNEQKAQVAAWLKDHRERFDRD